MARKKVREIIESGFKVAVPVETSFRFCECPTYQRISGQNLKEMDIGWFDIRAGKLIFLELKGLKIWEEFDNRQNKAHENLVKNLRGKITDVLLMLATVWVKTEFGKKIKKDLSNQIPNYRDGLLKFICLIDTPDSRKPLLLPVKDAVNKELAGRVRLFGVQHVTLIDFDKAQEMGLPVVRTA